MADEDERVDATAIVGTVRQTMTFVGPLAGVLVVAVGSPATAFLVDALTFVASAVLVAGLKPRRARPDVEAPAAWTADLAAGIRTVRSTTGLRTTVALAFVM